MKMMKRAPNLAAGSVLLALLVFLSGKLLLAVPLSGQTAPDDAYKLLVDNDYLQAIKVAQRNLPTSTDRGREYAIIGIANYFLNRTAGAELYLKQAISFSGTDETFRQTARLYFFRIRYDKFQTSPSRTSHIAMQDAARAFISSGTDTLLQSNQETLKWVGDVLDWAQSISGVWISASGPDLRIKPDGPGRYSVSAVRNGSSSELTSFITGSLTKADGVFRGTWRHKVYSLSAPYSCERTVSVVLTPSAGYNTLQGTETYGACKYTGPDFFAAIARRVYGARTSSIVLSRHYRR